MFAIAVHAGAGFHSRLYEREYTRLCKSACLAASDILCNGTGDIVAIDAATAAVCVLEDHVLTNAGYGSCLTLDGGVECDAGLMSGTTLHFGSVGTVSGIKNPILVAKKLLLDQRSGTASLIGRINPMTLCGDGARKWANEVAGIPIISDEYLISQSSKTKWQKYRHLMSKYERKHSSELSSFEMSPPQKSMKLCDAGFDTVGAVCVDASGHVCSAVSSGGIPLKHSGRIGQASVYGCGSWADSSSLGSIGVVTSGTGEQLVKTQLAQRIGDSILNGSDELLPNRLKNTFETDFLNSRFLANEQTQKYGSAVGILRKPSIENGSTVELFFIHSTESLAFAYFVNNAMPKPVSHISRNLPSSNLSSNCYAFSSNLFLN